MSNTESKKTFNRFKLSNKVVFFGFSDRQIYKIQRLCSHKDVAEMTISNFKPEEGETVSLAKSESISTLIIVAEKLRDNISHTNKARLYFTKQGEFMSQLEEEYGAQKKDRKNITPYETRAY